MIPPSATDLDTTPAADSSAWDGALDRTGDPAIDVKAEQIAAGMCSDPVGWKPPSREAWLATVHAYSEAREEARRLREAAQSRPVTAGHVEIEQLARDLAVAFHGDEMEWRGFLSKAELILGRHPSVSPQDGKVVDGLDPVRTTLRLLEDDLRGCVVALGEGDDLGAVLTGYADAAKLALSRSAAPPALVADRAAVIEECAKVADDQTKGWVHGEAVTAIGQAYQRACRNTAAAIRALAPKGAA